MFIINNSSIEPVLFGVTGGLLSLVGLIAIYVSINSQQNIQKAKEYLWELQSLTLLSKDLEERTSKRIRWIFRHYTDLHKTSIPLLTIVVIAGIVLVFCGVSWWSYSWPHISSISQPLFWFLFVASLILISFIIMLFLLTQTKVIGSLPKPKDLLLIEFKDKDPRKYVKVADIDIAELMFTYAKIELVFSDADKKVVTFRVTFPVEIKFKKAVLILHIVEAVQKKFDKLPKVNDTAHLREKLGEIGSSRFFVFTNTVLLSSDQEAFDDLYLRLELREEGNDSIEYPYLIANFKVPAASLNNILQGEEFYPHEVKHRLNSKEFAEAFPELIALTSMAEYSLRK